MSVLFKNGTIVTMNPNRDVIQGDILVEGDRIARIGNLESIVADQVVDATDRVIIPGLIQGHIHLCQALFRGMADDLELLDWLKLRIWPLEGGHDEESLYYSSLLGIGELMRGGTTGIIDMGTVHHTDSIFRAVRETGIRYLGGKCMMDYGDEVPATLLEDTDASITESVRLLEKWNGQADGRIHYAFCPRFAVSCTDKLLREVKKLADQYQVTVHTHASESKGEIAVVEKERGMRNVLYINSLGLCNERLVLAHCIHLDDEEMQVLAQTGTHICHCPGSNLKLASGIAPIPRLLELGASVALGADGAPCNNNLSQFVEMRLAALVQKPLHGPTAMPANKVFEMATLGGARAMRLEHEVGSLEVGKKADLAVVDLSGWHTWPRNAASVYAQLVYQAQANDVVATMIDGQMVYLDGQMLTINQHEVMDGIDRGLQRVIDRVGLDASYYGLLR
ncbi:MAG: 5'-deoxyadenosine deaminase [Methylocystaceae bacterium]